MNLKLINTFKHNIHIIIPSSLTMASIASSEEAEPPVQLSDRRLGKAVRLLRLSASLCGAREVCELDAGEAPGEAPGWPRGWPRELRFMGRFTRKNVDQLIFTKNMDRT